MPPVRILCLAGRLRKLRGHDPGGQVLVEIPVLMRKANEYLAKITNNEPLSLPAARLLPFTCHAFLYY